MISEGLALFGFDSQTWGRLSGLLLGSAERPDLARGLLVLFVDSDGSPIAALDSRDGAFEPEAGALGDLRKLCEARGARACFVMDALPAAELDTLVSVPLGSDYESEASWLLRLAEHAVRGGLRRIHPNLPMNPPLPFGSTTEIALDLLLPPDHCLLLTVFDGAEIWTGAALHRGAELDMLAGPTALRDWTGPLGGDWRRDQRVVLRAVERELGPVHLAVFAARPTAERLFASPAHGSWALSYLTKEIIVSPSPAYLTAALALDGAAGMGRGFLGLFEGMEKEELFGILQGFWRGLTDNQGLTGLLDFLHHKETSTKTDLDPPKDEK